jgi:predicted PurR-regulated permease PerM
MLIPREIPPLHRQGGQSLSETAIAFATLILSLLFSVGGAWVSINVLTATLKTKVDQLEITTNELKAANHDLKTSLENMQKQAQDNALSIIRDIAVMQENLRQLNEHLRGK